MLAASALLILILVLFLKDHPIGMLFVFALTLFPGLVFLYLSCVRAGLVALKASGPPNMKKLVSGTIRLFRFNVMLNNLIITLIGIGGSVAMMMILTPDVWSLLNSGITFSNPDAVNELITRLSQVPIGVFLMPMIAISLSNGLLGTSSASVAASAAEVGPNHHALWGLARKFVPLFVLSLLVLFVPTVLLIFVLGGPLTTFAELANITLAKIVLIPLYLIWAGCAVCAGKALAYAQTVKDLESEFQKERDDMMGEAVPQNNLRELRLKRQEAARMDH